MKHSMRSFALLIGLGLAVTGIGHATPLQAHPRVAIGVEIGTPPPPPLSRHVPPPRPGYVWAPGYWRWSPRVHRHIWVSGYWLHARPGYRYRAAHWVRHGANWRFHRGYWRH